MPKQQKLRFSVIQPTSLSFVLQEKTSTFLQLNHRLLLEKCNCLNNVVFYVNQTWEECISCLLSRTIILKLSCQALSSVLRGKLIFWHLVNCPFSFLQYLFEQSPLILTFNILLEENVWYKAMDNKELVVNVCWRKGIFESAMVGDQMIQTSEI